jgi:hypothetical protein
MFGHSEDPEMFRGTEDVIGRLQRGTLRFAEMTSGYIKSCGSPESIGNASHRHDGEEL